MEPPIQTRVHRIYQKLLETTRSNPSPVHIYTRINHYRYVIGWNRPHVSDGSGRPGHERGIGSTLYQHFFFFREHNRSMLLADRFSVSLSLRLSRWSWGMWPLQAPTQSWNCQMNTWSCWTRRKGMSIRSTMMEACRVEVSSWRVTTPEWHMIPNTVK